MSPPLPPDGDQPATPGAPSGRPGGWRARVVARLARGGRALAERLGLAGPLPTDPPPGEEENMVLFTRRQRAARPRWQRRGFVGVVGALLAGMLGPGPVLFALAGWTLAVVLWPRRWPGRVLTVGAAAGWSLLLLGWRGAVPVAGLVVFARWFTTPAPPRPRVLALPVGATLTGPPDPDLDPGVSVDAPGPVVPPAAVVLPAVLATPDPGQHARVDAKVARWPEIAQAAGLPGTQLHDLTVDAYGWGAKLLLRPGQVLRQAMEAKAALESALEVRPRAVRIDEDPTLARRVRLRVVERDPFAHPIDWPGPCMGSITRPLLYGPYEDGTACTVGLAGQHVFIVGATGSGKSVLLNLTVGELVAVGDTVVWGIDFKGGAELGPWARCLGRIATTASEAEQLLAAAVAVLEARAARGVKAWPTSPTHPELKIVVDEHAELVRQSKQAIQLEESVANRGRSVGVGLILTSLRATHDTLGSDQLRQQLRVRICMGLEDPRDADLVFGNGAARHGWDPELLNAPGKFFVRARSQGLTIPRLARAFYVDDHTVDELAGRYARQPTRLDPLSEQAAARFPVPTHPALPPGPGSGMGTGNGAVPPTGTPATPGPDLTGPVPGPGTPSPGPDPAPTLVVGDPVGRLLTALHAAGPQGVRVPELAERSGQDGPTVHAQLLALDAAGQVERCGHGRWRPTQPRHP